MRRAAPPRRLVFLGTPEMAVPPLRELVAAGFDLVLVVTRVDTLPSYFEGFPNSLLEAMASGLPVVATPVGSIESIVKHGVNGLLVEMKNSQQIAQSLSTLINDATYRLNLGKAARKSVLEKNTIATAIEKLKKIL